MDNSAVFRPKLKTDMLKLRLMLGGDNIRIDYEADADILSISCVQKDVEVAVRYTDNDVHLLYLPETFEVVGFWIEGLFNNAEKY